MTSRDDATAMGAGGAMTSRDQPRMSTSDELRYCRNALADALAERDAEQARNATLTDTIQRVEATHTRAYTAGHGGTRIAYCEQDSEAAQEWVSWPCPTVRALDGPGEEDG